MKNNNTVDDYSWVPLRAAYKTLKGLEKAAKNEGYSVNCYNGSSVSLYKTGCQTLLYVKDACGWIKG